MVDRILGRAGRDGDRRPASTEPPSGDAGSDRAGAPLGRPPTPRPWPTRRPPSGRPSSSPGTCAGRGPSSSSGTSPTSSSSSTATACSATTRRSSAASPGSTAGGWSSSASRRAPRPRRTSGATSGCPTRRATASRCGSWSWPSGCGLPVVTFIDVPGAHPGPESEERGIAEAIARSIALMSRLRTPIVAVITGEGGSGRRARDRGRRRGDRARERGLLGDLARGLRLDPVADAGPGRDGGGRDEDDRRGPGGARGHRPDRRGAGRRGPDRPRRDGRPAEGGDHRSARAAREPAHRRAPRGPLPALSFARAVHDDHARGSPAAGAPRADRPPPEPHRRTSVGRRHRAGPAARGGDGPRATTTRRSARRTDRWARTSETPPSGWPITPRSTRSRTS